MNKNLKKEKSIKQNGLLGYVWAILLILVIQTFLYQPFTIPSGSMVPTLLVGDFIMVNKFAYGYSRYSMFLQPKFIKGRFKTGEPKQGDVVVFFHDYKLENEAKFYDRGMFGGFFQRLWRNIRCAIGCPSEGVSYVKRVIGLPGDHIQMRNGQLFINNVPTQLTRKGDYPLFDDGMPPIAKLYEETLPNGVKHYILKAFDFGKASLDNTEEFVVPEKSYFCMGDNRDNSCDSRDIKQVGFIDENKLIGGPTFLFFSTNAKLWQVHKWLFSIRWKRLFHAYWTKLLHPFRANLTEVC
ncbi:MAG: signal peptidase I [Holosporales bacterium]|nr:signal peptidase I [Holosporales bacterium]